MKNNKTLSMLALGLLLGGGAIGAMQVSANNASTTNNTPVINTVEQSTTTEKIAGETVDKSEVGDVADGKESVTNEKDGINHQFEGDEGNHQD